MEYKLLSEVSVYRKDRIGSDKVNKYAFQSWWCRKCNYGCVR